MRFWVWYSPFNDKHKLRRGSIPDDIYTGVEYEQMLIPKEYRESPLDIFIDDLEGTCPEYYDWKGLHIWWSDNGPGWKYDLYWCADPTQHNLPHILYKKETFREVDGLPSWCPSESFHLLAQIALMDPYDEYDEIKAFMDEHRLKVYHEPPRMR